MPPRYARTVTTAITRTPAHPTATMARPGSRAASSSEPAPGMDTEAMATAATIAAAIMGTRAMAMDAQDTSDAQFPTVVAPIAEAMLADRFVAATPAEQPEA